jgi:hypothetical protein
MTAVQLLAFIEQRIPTFTDLNLLGAGCAFHYTANANAIDASGKFFGAPIDENLDKKQTALHSPPATSDPGVVFGYLKPSDAVEEGFGCEIYEIHFREAVSCIHSQEDAFSAEHAEGEPFDYPPTIMILTSDIMHFKRLGHADLCKQE